MNTYQRTKPHVNVSLMGVRSHGTSQLVMDILTAQAQQGLALPLSLSEIEVRDCVEFETQKS